VSLFRFFLKIESLDSILITRNFLNRDHVIWSGHHIKSHGLISDSRQRDIVELIIEPDFKAFFINKKYIKYQW